MSKKKCGCVYADARNTQAVRLGYEMSGYLKIECEKCKQERQEKALRG